jgi:hypothetical protein
MTKLDWTDLAQVIAYAKRLGPGMFVVKHPTRPNYNITHANRAALLRKHGIPIIHKT